MQSIYLTNTQYPIQIQISDTLIKIKQQLYNMELIPVLQNGFSSSNPEVQKNAENQILALIQVDPQTFIFKMAQILSNQAVSEGVRQGAAALISRTAFYIIKGETDLAWRKYDPQIKKNIRSLLLGTLGSNSILARRGASDAISKIATIDVPQGHWDELLQSLVNAAQNTDDTFKKTAIMALGFICSEFKQHKVGITYTQTEQIFAAIFIGLSSQNTEVKREALKALTPCVIYMNNIFGNQKFRERTMIPLLQSLGNPDLAQESLEVFIQYARHYYDYLGEIIQQLYSISTQIIDACGTFTVTALELWHTIADHYLNNKKSQNYLAPLADDLVKRLLTCMIFCSKDDDNNIREAAYRTLFPICESCESICMETICNFVSHVIGSSDWKHRQAAAIAFSAITNTKNKIVIDWLQAGIDQFFGLLADHDQFVIESTAFGLSKIFENHAELILKRKNYIAYIDCFTMLLQRNQNIIDRSLQALAKLTENLPNINCDLSKNILNVLSTITNFILQQPYGKINSNQLQNASVVILQLLQGNKDQKINKQYTQHIATQCTKLIVNDEYTKNLKSCLLVILHTAILMNNHGLDEGLTRTIANMIQNHFKLIKTVDQDGLFVIAAIAIKTQQGFYNYYNQLIPYVNHGLSLKNEPSTYKVCIGVICDICKQIGKYIPHDIDKYLESFILEFQSEGDRNIKGPLISSIGDLIRDVSVSQIVIKYYSSIIQIATVSISACLLLSASLDDVDYAQELKQVLIGYMQCLCSGLSEDHVEKIPEILVISMGFILNTCKRECNPTLNFFKQGIFLIFDVGSVLIGNSAYIQMAKESFSNPEFIQIFNSLREIQFDDDVKGLQSYGRAVFTALKVSGVKYS